jgi:hypothetical protein
MKTASVVLLLAGLLLVHGCGSDPASPGPTACPHVVLQAPSGALQGVATVTLTVTGPGMSAITRNMNVQGQQATLTLSVPAGDDRVFAVTAKDAGNNVLATGVSDPVDLVAGDSRSVTIPLQVTGSIIGSWRYDFDSYTYWIFTFEAGGVYKEYLYYYGDEYTWVGTYQISGNQVTTTVEGDSYTYLYEIGGGGNELTLTDEYGDSVTFYRVG